jgi:hypothetical protein
MTTEMINLEGVQRVFSVGEGKVHALRNGAIQIE